MRRYSLLLVAALLAAGLSCNLPGRTPSSPAPRYLSPVPPTSTPTPEPEQGEICVWAYLDSNRNAMHDDGERPLPGVRFSVVAGDVEVGEHLSDASPIEFCFLNLPPGAYLVQAEAPDSLEATNPTTLSIMLGADESLPVVLGFMGSPPAIDGRMPLAEAIVGNTPDGQTLFLIVNGQLQRSDDGGQSWNEVGERPPASHLVVSEADPDLLFAGDGFPCLRGGPSAPLFISSDGGGNWRESPGGADLLPTAAHPTDAAVAWAVGCDGVYRSDDGGNTWQLQPAAAWGLYLPEIVLPVAAQPRTLYASGNSEGGSGALLRSDDGGDSWRVITEELGLWITSVLVNPDDPDEVWFVTPAGVWRTQDGGAAWSSSAAGLEQVAVGDDMQFEGKGLYTLARAPSGLLLLGTARGVFESRDGGSSWSPQTAAPWGQEPVSHLTVTAAWPTIRLWAAAESGVYIYTPGGP